MFRHLLSLQDAVAISCQWPPTSANQEDPGSMACHAGRRLLDMKENLAGILGIEAMVAAQGIEYRAPLETGAALKRVIARIRNVCPSLHEDRQLDGDIAAMAALLAAAPLADGVEHSSKIGSTHV